MPCHSQLPPVDMHRISAVSILAGEHEVILQTLACLERMAHAVIRSQIIPTTQVHQVLQILRQFADRCHHGKEEDILFPAMEAHHPNFEPTAVMRAEHIQGRAYILGIAEALDSNHPKDFSKNAFAYVELLSQHIQKENEILFPIAQDMLTETEDQNILEAYRAIEHEDMGTGVHEHLLGLANELARFYGVPVASDNPETMTLLSAICGCKKECTTTSPNAFEKINYLAHKVAEAHGDSHPDMIQLADLVLKLATCPTHKLSEMVQSVEENISQYTNDYRPWLGSCTSVATLFNSLRSAVHQHSTLA